MTIVRSILMLGAIAASALARAAVVLDTFGNWYQPTSSGGGYWGRPTSVLRRHGIEVSLSGTARMLTSLEYFAYGDTTRQVTVQLLLNDGEPLGDALRPGTVFYEGTLAVQSTTLYWIDSQFGGYRKTVALPDIVVPDRFTILLSMDPTDWLDAYTHISGPAQMGTSHNTWAWWAPANGDPPYYRRNVYGNQRSLPIQLKAVPEPASFAVVLIGLAALAKRQRAKQA